MSQRVNSGFMLTVIGLVSLAIGIGWFYDRRLAPTTTEALLLPDNIDYYLSQVNYRAMNQQGTLHYQLLSPYLEHFIREDISQIQQPDLQLNGEQSSWRIQARNGTLQHQQEVFELQHQVEMLRNSAQDPMRLNTERMILRPQSNLIEIPAALTLVSSTIHLQAAGATLNIDKNYYQFNRVKATHQANKKTRELHEAS
ncbi:MAG: LPS export ABC transporter periplasmic protein LptC [Gammaproteobacteria bacterium]|nr:LPS export ABC transporter periplasmic protein LptC [Gammaproteobacteria bacterium]MBL6999494.1 LPS export ABC transporter periplasmic protein LptC [Gammaproteobacteria bacterium]